jgi:hypothetical protein
LRSLKDDSCYHEPHDEPDPQLYFVPREVEKEELAALVTLVCLSHRDDKQLKLVLEYATISGAGKSRWLFHAFKEAKFKTWGEDSPPFQVSVLHTNFNGADDSVDCRMTERPGLGVDCAIARLLLSRGLFECKSDMTWLTNGKEFPDDQLPNVEAIIDAVFESRFKDGKGLLVVHLDEFSMLKEAKLEYVRKKNDGKVIPEDELVVFNWLKGFVQTIGALTSPARQRYVISVMTHTSPAGRIMGEDRSTSCRYIPLRLYPFTMEQSWDLLVSARGCRRKLSTEEIQTWRPCVALAGGHPSLLLDLRLLRNSDR